MLTDSVNMEDMKNANAYPHYIEFLLCISILITSAQFVTKKNALFLCIFYIQIASIQWIRIISWYWSKLIFKGPSFPKKWSFGTWSTSRECEALKIKLLQFFVEVNQNKNNCLVSKFLSPANLHAFYLPTFTYTLAI